MTGRLDFQLVLKALDRASGPVGGFIGWINRMRSSANAASAAGARADGAMGRLERTLRKGGRAGGGGTWISGLATSIGGLTVKLASLAGAAAGAGSVLFGKGVLETGAQFERFETILTTIEGSGAAARKSMNWVQQFAAVTPYELGQVMDAFVRLRAYGIEPTNGTLRSLGDASSAMGKDLMAAVEMLADAQTGEFERLKEFGIRASAKGREVTLTYTKAGKDMSVTVNKSASEIRRALLGIFDSRFSGAMAAQSRTFDGMMSNLKDSWTGFLRAVADAGVFEVAKGELAKLLTFITQAQKDGRLAKWAKELSGELTSLVKTLARLGREVDWVGLAQALITIGNAMAGLARAIAAVGRAYKGLSDSPFGQASQIMGNPVLAIRAATQRGFAPAPARPTVAGVKGQVDVNVRVTGPGQVTTVRSSGAARASAPRGALSPVH